MPREVVLVLEPADAAHDPKDRVFVIVAGFEELLEVQREFQARSVTGDASGALVVRPCEPNRPATWNSDRAARGLVGAKVVCDTNAGPRVPFAHLTRGGFWHGRVVPSRWLRAR